MVMTSRPARVRRLRSRASTVSVTNGSVQDKHDRRETCVGAAAVGQRRLGGLEEEGMGTAQQRAMQADALIHGFAQMAPLMRCEGHLPYRGKQLSIICIPLGGHLTIEDQSHPLTLIGPMFFRAPKGTSISLVAFAE